jgi:hypothetical protein
LEDAGNQIRLLLTIIVDKSLNSTKSLTA